jgi:exonuclease III
MSQEFVVATANTKLGHMVRVGGGLEPVADVDVLLLQEVHADRDDLESRLLAETDLELAISAGGLGLAIAVSRNLPVTTTDESKFIERGRFSRFAVCHLGEENIAAFRMRARGVLSATVELDDKVVEFMSAHAPVAFYPPGRRLYNKKFADMMNHSSFDHPIVVGGDWNSWPRANKHDKAARHNASLTEVDLQGQITFSTEGTIFENISTRIQRLSRLAEISGIDPAYFSWDGELDALLYRDPEGSLRVLHSELVDTASDHKAIIATFEL